MTDANDQSQAWASECNIKVISSLESVDGRLTVTIDATDASFKQKPMESKQLIFVLDAFTCRNETPEQVADKAALKELFKAVGSWSPGRPEQAMR